MSKTLLQKAQIERRKVIPTMTVQRTGYPEQQLRDLAIAWLRCEISDKDLLAAMGKKRHARNSGITTAMTALRRGIYEGSIKI